MKDPERLAQYAAEDTASALDYRLNLLPADPREYAANVWLKALRRKFPGICVPIINYGGKGHEAYMSEDLAKLRFERKSASVLVVCHELAHLGVFWWDEYGRTESKRPATARCHGPEHRAVLLWLVTEACGAEAAKGLRWHFKAKGLRVSRRRIEGVRK